MKNVIYSITNIVNQKRYIGQTKDFLHRKVEHLSYLRRGTHHNKHLQRSFDEYGEENFAFEVLEINCQDLNSAEKRWIALYNTINNDCGYNMNSGGCDSSSKEQYRKIMIFDKRTGKLAGSFDTIKQCANTLGCHTSTIFSALVVNTRSAIGFYIRDYQEGVEEIDALKLKAELKIKKQRAGKIGDQVKKRLRSNIPSRLLSTEELLPMITGPIDQDNIQIHSIDLNVIKIEKLNDFGFIPKNGKTKISQYIEIPQQLLVVGEDEFKQPIESSGWILQPGTYNIEFAQGCNIPSYAMLLIRQRSSLLRNGGMISSSLWDANFQTNSMGTVMFLHMPIEIEYGARIATIYGHACEPVTKLYDGQWQNDKQRKS